MIMGPKASWNFSAGSIFVHQWAANIEDIE
jgi:hypothetical protein